MFECACVYTGFLEGLGKFECVYVYTGFLEGLGKFECACVCTRFLEGLGMFECVCVYTGCLEGLGMFECVCVYTGFLEGLGMFQCVCLYTEFHTGFCVYLGEVWVGCVRNFVLLSVHYIPLITLFIIELLKENKYFQGRRGGRRGKLVFDGDKPLGLGKIQGTPTLNETQVFVCATDAFGWLRSLLPGYT